MHLMRWLWGHQCVGCQTDLRFGGTWTSQSGGGPSRCILTYLANFFFQNQKKNSPPKTHRSTTKLCHMKDSAPLFSEKNENPEVNQVVWRETRHWSKFGCSDFCKKLFRSKIMLGSPPNFTTWIFHRFSFHKRIKSQRAISLLSRRAPFSWIFTNPIADHQKSSMDRLQSFATRLFRRVSFQHDVEY